METKKTRSCGTYEVHKRFLETYPNYGKRMEEIERFTREYLKINAKAGLRTGIVKIPVVVHVVYKTAAQNISDAQIQSQITVLNEDYRGDNSDASSIPNEFQSFFADVRIEFQLAVRDPDCNATTGITRTDTTTVQFTTNDDVKSSATGGQDPWDRDKYLNIWVCNLSVLGYATYPGANAAVDGVVCAYDAFGNTGTAAAPYDQGRTATHEIGHWLNLIHIWGDDQNDVNTCLGSDHVDDTPNQAIMNFGCPNFPHISCDNGPDGEMFMNYMDYVDDSCMIMFSAGQTARMDAALYGTRAAILASDALIDPPSTPGSDLWSQNTPEDIGDEPDQESGVFCRSDDIWVRKQNDGITQQDHENPEYRPDGFGSNFVYVRIRNRGCEQSGDATVNVYWAKASPSLGWPAPFDGSVTEPDIMGGLIGTGQTGNIEARGYIILEFPWYPPNPEDYSSFGLGKSHFCLLSRIETSPNSPYGMTFPEGSSLGTNVKNNNNIVWKNMDIVDENQEGNRVAFVSVGNFEKAENPMKFIFQSPSEKKKFNLFKWGTIEITLGKELFNIWEKGGSIGDGIKAGKNYTITLSKTDAWIGNIAIKPDNIYTIRVQFLPFKELIEGYHIFFFDIFQYEVEKEGKEREIGGQRFVFKTIPTFKKNEKRIKVILDRIRILDDHDPCLKDKGELTFTAIVVPDNDVSRRQVTRLPPIGHYKIGDKPRENDLNLVIPIFEGNVWKKSLNITISGKEIDIFDPNDELMRYHREFSGDPETWIGKYFPSDEYLDKEDLRDWMVWYKIIKA